MIVFEPQPGHATSAVLLKECAVNLHGGMQSLVEQHGIQDPSEFVTPIMLDLTTESHLPHLRIGFIALDSQASYLKKDLVHIGLVSRPVKLEKGTVDARWQYPHMRITPTTATTASLVMGGDVYDAAWRYLGRGITESMQGRLLQTLTMVDILGTDLSERQGLQPVI